MKLDEDKNREDSVEVSGEDKKLSPDNDNVKNESEQHDDNLSHSENSQYDYDDGEFNPDEWSDKKSSTRQRTGHTQKAFALAACLIALILFAALFIVEFRSYTRVKKTDTTYVSQDKKEDTNTDNDAIMTIIETGTNYTIYLDNETGVEYIMFKVGSSISIQPLINSDGSYKKYVAPTVAPGSSENQTTANKHSWLGGLKGGSDTTASTQAAGQPSTAAQQTATAAQQTATEAATKQEPTSAAQTVSQSDTRANAN